MSDDPTAGTWFTYGFDLPTNADYPQIAVGQDAYYLSVNCACGPAVAYALEKATMLAGAPSPQFEVASAPALAGFNFQALAPVSLSGPNPPPATMPGYYIRHRDDELHSPFTAVSTDFLELWAFTVDWTGVLAPMFTKVSEIAINDFSSVVCAVAEQNECVPQPGTSVSLDAVREVVMRGVQYRAFTSYETIVGAFTVAGSAPNMPDVSWFELRRYGSMWQLIQEGRITGDNEARWLPSAAMNSLGSIAIGYSVSSAQTPPSIRVASRLASDTQGTMQAEAAVVSGTVQTSDGRWGDFSSMSVSGDDVTFIYTNQYITSGPNQWMSRIVLLDAEMSSSPTPTASRSATRGLTPTRSSTRSPSPSVRPPSVTPTRSAPAGPQAHTVVTVASFALQTVDLTTVAQEAAVLYYAVIDTASAGMTFSWSWLAGMANAGGGTGVYAAGKSSVPVGYSTIPVPFTDVWANRTVVILCLVAEAGSIRTPVLKFNPLIYACGDALVTPPEECDDGNVASGDGCSSTCTIEPSATCEVLPTGTSSCSLGAGSSVAVIASYTSIGSLSTTLAIVVSVIGGSIALACCLLCFFCCWRRWLKGWVARHRHASYEDDTSSGSDEEWNWGSSGMGTGPDTDEHSVEAPDAAEDLDGAASVPPAGPAVPRGRARSVPTILPFLPDDDQPDTQDHPGQRTAADPLAETWTAGRRFDLSSGSEKALLAPEKKARRTSSAGRARAGRAGRGSRPREGRRFSIPSAGSGWRSARRGRSRQRRGGAASAAAGDEVEMLSQEDNEASGSWDE